MARMSTIDLDPDHAESMLRLIEASLQVKRRHQFYHWTQGDMQRLVPHKVSTCGAYDLTMRDLSFNVLNSVPLAEPLLHALGEMHSPVMTYLRAQWVKCGQRVCWVDLSDLALHDEGAQGLCEQGYRWLLADGVCRPGRPHDLETFFAFGQPGCLPDEQSSRILNLLLPYVHATFVRVHSTERELAGMGSHVRGPAMAGGTDRPRAVATITDREREILRWVREGKSNQAISEELGISALTVKNHIQKILRKLGAANRAQAVAKAMSMNLFTPATEAPSRRLLSDRVLPTGV
jgi:transcriptional regulator EpsA